MVFYIVGKIKINNKKVAMRMGRITKYKQFHNDPIEMDKQQTDTKKVCTFLAMLFFVFFTLRFYMHVNQIKYK